MRTITLRSPAKINLILKVLRKRDDGFHELKTLFERIDLSDTISLKINRSGRVRIFCQHPQVPKGPTNLVYKIAERLKNDFNIRQGVDIRIIKRIPVAAGLGGGSSNAATVLKGLNKLWNLKLSLKQMAGYADRVGSDVTFFLYDTSWAVGTGRGEKIQKKILPVRLWHLLVTPKVKMYTREVYGRLNLKLTNRNDDVNILLHYLRKNDFSRFRDILSNDLENPILLLSPNLLKLKEKLQKLKPLGVVFSGSGPSVFAVFGSQKEAQIAQKIVQKQYKQVFVVRTH